MALYAGRDRQAGTVTVSTLSSMPLVSIVTPVYNGARFIGDLIDSVGAQTYPHIEVVVIDDGSDDGGATAAIAAAYGDRITCVRQTNGGVAAALNRGIAAMRGTLFSWLSHDDLYLADKVERQVEAYLAFGQRCIVIGDFELFGEDGSVVLQVEGYRNVIVAEAPVDAVS